MLQKHLKGQGTHDIAGVCQFLTQPVQTPLQTSVAMLEVTGNSESTASVPTVPQRVYSDNDFVNLEFLKHVVLKFINGKPSETKHLLKVLAAILKFTPREEVQARKSMEGAQGWF